VLPVSGALQKAIEDYGIKAKFSVVPNVIDASLFSLPKSATAARTVKKILFVGNLVPVKGLEYLLRALAGLRHRNDWRLDVVGAGPLMAAYRQLAADLGISERMAFHGLLGKREVAEFMKDCDFLVQPSLCETFGIVPVEAMACGKPVVASDLDALRGPVTPERGMLVSPGNADILRDVIGRMLDNHQNYSPQKISRWAAENFGREAVGAKLNGIYRELAEKKYGKRLGGF
jgi:L-malate glycosyltransferase